MSAADIGLPDLGRELAIFDPECPEHGYPECVPDDESYVRMGDMECQRCGKLYSRHQLVRCFDGFDGQSLILRRVCDGRLVKL